MSEAQPQTTIKRMRRPPPPKRGRPGSKRPRTVFNLDDVTVDAGMLAPTGHNTTNAVVANNSEQQHKGTASGTLSHGQRIITTTQQQQQQQQELPVGQNTAPNTANSNGNPISEEIIRNDPPRKKSPLHPTAIQSFPANPLEKQRSRIITSEHGTLDGTDHDDDNNNHNGHRPTNETDRPWWAKAENEHLLEGWIMKKLDAKIRKAERDEERFLMNYFDEKIMMHQLSHDIDCSDEKIMMHQLSQDIDAAAAAAAAAATSTAKEQHREPPISSTQTERPEASPPAGAAPATLVVEFETETKQTNMPPTPAEPPETSQMEFQKETNDKAWNAKTEALETTAAAAAASTSSVVAASSTATPSTSKDPPGTTVIRRALPKWIPKHFMEDLYNPLVRLFTPEEFDSFVIQPLIQKLSRRNVQIRLLEDLPGDEHSYLLEAKIFPDPSEPKNSRSSLEQSLEHLWSTTDAYLRSKISGVNLKFLLEDGASLEIELVVNLAEPLGVSFRRFTFEKGVQFTTSTQENLPGLWITRVEPGKGIAKALGSHEAFCYGCALLSVDGTTIRDPLELRKILRTAKSREGKTKCISLRICLSKHSDLTGIRLAKLLKSYKLRRRDGKPIDANLYSGLPSSFHPPFPGQPNESKGAVSYATRVGDSASSSRTQTSSDKKDKENSHPSSQKNLKRTHQPSPSSPAPAAKRVRENEPSEKNHHSEKDNDKESCHELPSIPKKSTKPSIQQQQSQSQNPQSRTSELPDGPSRTATDTTMSKPNLQTDTAARRNSSDKNDSDMSVSSSSTDNNNAAKSAADAPAGNEPSRNAADSTVPKPSKAMEAVPSLPSLERKPSEKSGSDMSMSSTSSRNTGTFEPPKPVTDNRPSNNSASHIDIGSLLTAEKTPLSKPSTNDHPIKHLGENKIDAAISISRTTTTLANDASKGDKESLPRPMGDQNKDKSKDSGRHCQTANHNNSTGATSKPPSRENEDGVLSDVSDPDDRKGNNSTHRTWAQTRNVHSKPPPIADQRRGITYPSEQDRAQQWQYRGPEQYLHLQRRHSDFTSSQRWNNNMPPPQRHRRYSDHMASGFGPFEVALDSTKPLGGYFRTEKGQNFQPKCVVFSMHQWGQLARDSRIKIGTQVTAILVGERRMIVTGLNDLTMRYSEAKRYRKNLRLILQNNHSCRVESQHASRVNWSHDGDWIGIERNGWAGGAVESRSSRNFAAPNERRQSAGSFNSSPRWGSGSFSPSNINRESPSWEGSSSPRMGSFSPNLTEDDEERRPNAPPLPGEEAFVDAIRNKSWKDLIDVIRKGKDFSTDFVIHVLKKQYKYVDDELKKSNSDASENGPKGFRLALWERLDMARNQQTSADNHLDLEAKKKILKFYINSVHLIDKAMALRNWTEIMIEMKFLQLFYLPSKSGRSNVISTKVRRVNPDTDLCHLPVETMKSRISYSSNNEFSVHNNYFTALTNRKLLVEILEGDPKVDQMPPKKLGQFIFTLNEIEKLSPSEGIWKDIEKRSDGFGIIGLCTKRRSADKDYFATKRQEIRGMIKTQLETIDRFNEEFCSGANVRYKLTPNVRGLHGVPLLTACVEIMADLPLIEKMVSLGANPRELPGSKARFRMSALALARKQRDKVQAKARGASEHGEQARKAFAEKLREAERVVTLLETARF